MAEALSLQQLTEDLKNAGFPWEMDPNTDMALMTEDERRLRLGFTPSPDDMPFEEAVRLSDVAIPLTAEAIAMEATVAPAAYDLRNVNGRNYTTPVKNQGGCGSCVAFGTVAVLETTAKRTRNNPNLNLDLSEAHMFYCHAKEEGRNCGNGWWPDKALDKAKDKGVTFDTYFPYTAGDQDCALQSGWMNALAKPTSYTKLNSRAKMKEHISTRGSITGCFVVYQDFFSYRSGVYRHVSGNAAGGHCVEIIGYNNAQGCWICKNSWGTNWGEGGYFRIAYGQCNIETWSGPYGVNGVSLRTWNRNTRVNGLWTNSSDRNAYVHLAGHGWRQVARTTNAVQHTMLSQLIAAKAANRRVDALEDNNQIREVYVV
jgi:C1A family cysteine protease